MQSFSATTCFTILVSISAFVSCNAQDQCGDILTAGIHNTYQQISRDDSRAAYQQALCDQNSSLYNSQSSTGGGISVFGIGGADAQHGQQEVNNLYHSHCENQQKQLSDDDFNSLVEVTIDPNIVDNWRECMQANGKGLFANVDVNGAALTFTLDFEGLPGVNEAKILANPQVQGAVCSSSQFRAGIKLAAKVDKTELCERLGRNSVTFVVNTSAGSKTLKLAALPDLTPRSVKYRPHDMSSPAFDNLNTIVTRTPGSLEDKLVIQFELPNTLPIPRGLALPLTFHRILVYGSQNFPAGPGRPFPEWNPLPESTFPHVDGTWKTSDKVSITVDIPKQFSDPSQGWDIRFCVMDSSSGCDPSPNLLLGTPI